MAPPRILAECPEDAARQGTSVLHACVESEFPVVWTAVIIVAVVALLGLAGWLMWRRLNADDAAEDQD